MPYRQVYEPAPKDLSLAVFKELPAPFVETDERAYFIKPEFRVARDHDLHYMYFCERECKGWIEGRPNRFTENTLAPLSGRQGEVYYCRRCGEEIAFFGIVS